VGQTLLIIEKSRSHSDTPHLVRLLWTSDQPDNTQHSQETDIHVPSGIRTHIPSKRAATGIGLYKLSELLNITSLPSPPSHATEAWQLICLQQIM